MNNASRHRNRHRRPQCVVEGCRRPRAVSSHDNRVKTIPLCWSHIGLAAKIEEAAARQSRLNLHADAAAKAGRKPEEMFWAPDLYESQVAQDLQIKYEEKRDLQHYRELVAVGKIKRPKGRDTTIPQQIEGTVYYLRVGSYIKIGWSANLEKRMRSYPPDTILLATEPGTRKDEHRRHKMFAAHRTHGREWYAMVPSLMHHIEQTAARHGQPDPVVFAAQPVTIPQPRPVEPIRPAGWRGPWAS